MTTSPQPPLSPYLICAGAERAIDFYKAAFGATELFRLNHTDGNAIMHAALSVNGAMVMLTEENQAWGARSPKSLAGTPVTLHLYVPDVDASIARAAAAGANVVIPAADMFWGDRYGLIEDPFGHRWSIATHQRDMTNEEIAEAMRAAPPCTAEPPAPAHG